MSMLLRRRMMGQGGEPPAPAGTYIYMIKDVPTTKTDTGIKLADTNKAFTILTEMSFPDAYINDRGTWTGVGSDAIYSDGTFNGSAQDAAALLANGNNFFRIRFFEGGAYRYAANAEWPYLSNDRRHRFAHWHLADSSVSTINLDGCGEITTASGTYAASNGTLFVKATAKTIIHALYIYDKVLTSQEISDFISDGIIP